MEQEKEGEQEEIVVIAPKKKRITKTSKKEDNENTKEEKVKPIKTTKKEQKEQKENKDAMKKEEPKDISETVDISVKNTHDEFVGKPELVTNLPEVLTILMSYFIVGHKYVGLQFSKTKDQNSDILPAFFVVLEHWTDENTLLCQFVKHNTTTSLEDKSIHVQPLWEELWCVQSIDTNTIWNCIPFDEKRDYHYVPVSLSSSPVSS
jgi:hypothetical protein